MGSKRRLPEQQPAKGGKRARKVARSGGTPPIRPRRLKPHAAEPDTYLSWRFDLADTSGRWSCNVIEQAKVYEVVAKIRHFESMTIHELGGPRMGCKAIPVGSICSEARARLEYLKLDDCPSLYEFHIAGKERVWSVRYGSIFHVLWWDPEHTVCPSELKNT